MNDKTTDEGLMPQFSIVIPTFNRADGRLQRALDSVMTQVYEDWECVVVDDGSTDDTDRLFPIHYHIDEGFRYIRHDQRQGRVIARNTGMKAATGEWICWTDSDDALDPMYLATFAYNIEQDPDARLFCCGVVVHGQEGPANARICPKWTTIRRGWVPPLDETGEHVHALFDSGHVGAGMFVFHRECLDKIGLMPEWRTPDHIADGLDEWMGLEFGTTGYGSGARAPVVKGHVGNPFGEDHAMYQALCLHYQVHLIGAALYTQYVR